MSAYHWLVILVVLFAFLLHGEREKNAKYIVVAAILMFCVLGLRDVYTIGNDTTSSYLHHFESMEDADWSDLPGIHDWLHDDNDEDRSSRDRNIGFDWLMKIGYECTDGDYQLFISLVSAFVMIAIAQFIYRYSPSPVQSILYYFGLLLYTFHFSGLKQSIAMSLLLFAFSAVTNRRLIRFIVTVVFASFFHFPALVFLPAYWIGNMKLGKSYLIFLGCLFLITYLFRDQLVEWMRDTYETTIVENSGMRFLANKVIVMLVIVAAALVIRPPSASDKLYSSLLMFMGTAAVIQTFASYNNTFERLADYYFQFAIVFIPMVFEDVTTERRHLSKRELHLVRRVGPYMFCAFAIWRFIDNVTNNPFLYPYQFYFQAEEAEETLAIWLNLL